ncbi:hypothetical protein GGTG_06481 [Gaeumannomyces tritici R3-111a-1]|uniref:Uncharacterized protein n=1 Tax=Gaeumannomyces tritici (strain R3-111a-1) TaxID=644352 RepID=J3NYY0_GAET3|nr:hypothetical protein GGTG_06481 [Gaeumannomyces tritici R3-111a-1]EJT76563.1 hypothetical protein GGTG_06481 [Gaeumannomyces tritici R3-111a-1]
MDRSQFWDKFEPQFQEWNVRSPQPRVMYAHTRSTIMEGNYSAGDYAGFQPRFRGRPAVKGDRFSKQP